MKRYSTSVIIREVQIETTARHHVIPTKAAMIQNIVISVGKDVKQLELSHIAGGNIKW